MSDLPPGVTTPTPPPPAPTVAPPPPAQNPVGSPVNSAGVSQNPATTKLQAAAVAAPKLDPKTTVAVAQTASSPADAGVNAQVVQIFDAATKVVDVLGKQPARAQLAYWNRASAPERDLLSAAGYTPPEAPPVDPNAPAPQRGLFGSIWHDVAHGLDEARHGAASAGSWIVHKPLAYAGDVVNVGMGPLEHGIRSAIDLADVNDLAHSEGKETLGQDLRALIEPSQWVKAWHATANGTSSFQPQVVRSLSRTLTPFQLELAKRLAAGDNLQTVLSSVPEAQRAEAYSTIETDESFQQAVQLLSDSHLDLGQAIFGGLPYNIAGHQVSLDPAVNPFGLEVHPLSGIADGLVDWYDSPFIIGSSMRAASIGRRFAILDSLGNARDARALYVADPAVQRGMDSIAKLLTSPSTEDLAAGEHVATTPNIAAVIRRFPQLNPLADDLVAHYPQIAAAARDGQGGSEVANFFASEQALISLARGRAGLFFKKATLFPHLTVPQAMYTGGKDALSELLQRAHGVNLDVLSPRQWAKGVFGPDAERTGIDAIPKEAGPAARFARRATTLTPTKDYIDLADPDRAAVFHRYAEMFLPAEQADRLTNAFSAIPVTDQGRQIKMIHALQDELFSAAGLDESQAGREYVADWQRKRELGLSGEHYSFGNNAFYRNATSDDEVGREVAILPSQLSSSIAMPQFSDLYKLAKKSWALEKLGAVMDAHGLDRIMERWNALLLDRPGFGVRVALEEVLGAGLREGGISVARARVAASLLGIESPVTPEIRRWLPRLFQAIAGHVPGEALNAVETQADLDAVIHSWSAMHFLRKAGIAFTPEDLLDAAKWWAVNGRYRGPISESIDALTQHSGGIVDDEHGWTEAVRRWDGGETVSIRPTGKMARYGRLDEHAFPAMHYALSGIAMDAPGRAAAAALADGHDAQVAAVLRWMEDPANETLVRRFAASTQTPDGRLVESGEASQQEAYRAWAEKIVAHVNHYLTSSRDGSPLALSTFERGGDTLHNLKLADLIAEGEVPSTADLEAIDRRDLPDEIVAKELLPSLEGGLAKIIEKTMQQMVARPLNYLSRQPIFLHHFSTAFRESRELLESLGIHDEGDQLAGDIASERAWRETLPYIHNPRVRSQMSVITRNLAPFWFAQEQFYKRWARTFALYPEAFRKAQLLMNGLRSVGFVQKDQYGQDAFVYPGSGFVTSFLAKVFHANLPVVNQFTGEISQLNPSFATGGIVSFPSPGPFVSIPLETLNAALPELDPFVRAVMGPDSPAEDHSEAWAVQAASQLLDQTLPTLFQRMLPVFEGSTNPADPSYSSMLATAMIQAAQYLEATGHGPSTSEDPAEVDVFQQRLSNWARNMLLFRAAFGFAAPATPAFKISGGELGDELDALMATMPYDQAVAAFLKAHPDASPYTVFESTTSEVGQSGAYVPATQAALDFIDAHKAVFDRYSAAAPWLFPLSSGKGVFNDQAYLSELSMGLRARRDFGSWWQDVRYAEAANVYFPLETKVKAAEAANPGAKDQIQHAWDLWTDAFKAANPIFASMIDEPTASNRRAEVVQQMQQMISAGEMPKTPQAEHIALLMEGYQKVDDFYQATQGESAYSTQHTENKKAFLAWGDAIAKLYPDVATYWSSVLSKEIPG